jgi:hypothetical protein
VIRESIGNPRIQFFFRVPEATEVVVSNISSQKTTGIAAWNEAESKRALTQDTGRDGVRQELAAGVKRRGQAGWQLDSERFRPTPRTCGRFRGIVSLR